MKRFLLALAIAGLPIAVAGIFITVHTSQSRVSQNTLSISTPAAQAPPQDSRSAPSHSSQQAPAVPSGITSQDKSELDLVVGSVVLPMITDPDGFRTGENTSTTDSPLQEIPQSTSYDDSTEGITHFISIIQPKDGKYSIVLTAVKTGSYTLSIRLFSKDGAGQPEILYNGNIQQGSYATLLLDYDSAIGATSSLTTLTN